MRLAPVLLLLLVAIPGAAQPPAPRVATEATNGMVVCVSPPAADVGVAILKKGGNAVDAAVAVALAMAVTWPEAGNLGGGGFMMIAPPGQAPTCVEYRETAPAAAGPKLFADGTVSAFSHKASGVPGTVRGLGLAHKKYGKLPWKDVVMPAVELAEKGFTVTDGLSWSIGWVLASPTTTNAEFHRVYDKPGGGYWRPGDTMKLPDLGRTLRLIAEKGADEFYTGDPADKLAAEMKAGNGIMTKDDIAKYQAKERTPVTTNYRGYDVYGPPPPSSGGVGICLMLNVLENFDLKKQGRWSAATNHQIVETMKRSYADRARHLGDPDFTTIPPHLTTKAYAKKLAATIDMKAATPSEKVAPEIPLAGEGDSTTHFSVIDKDGLAVSNTYTLEHSFGSRVVVKGSGYILNNEMTDFNPVPGVTTKSGQIGTPANLVAPGKRMLSSQTPVIVRKDGKPVLLTGSPGGRTIINTSLCVVLNVLEFDMPVQEAVDAPRWHHQWFPDVARFEGFSTHPALVQELTNLGHRVSPGRQGDAHSIRVDPVTGRFLGAADRRIEGAAKGY
ncbi:gamma-glutamyltransferase [Urbifossiella limnaea]|uniref:Glutathione hydrolase proenzyme n=1 Tax=Urbifossiella limnaea TaxID=2528023 RepID=A0A517XZS2_9BACT|nr:gamma-glutamyltransferase [Urbifossiella limnaea]QDU23012.1 Gamma-glutamyltranspeptidase precursor [Urbifossiella limnaea]